MAVALVFSIFALSSLSIIPLSCEASVDTFVFGGCSRVKYTPNSPFESNINSLLTSLVNSATNSSYNNFTIMVSAPTDLLYGLYQCRGDLSMPDCAMCVARAVSQLGVLCSQTCGAALQLQGCFVKYDNVTFLGVEDKTVLLKKCGPSVGYQTDTMSRRDAVLAGLAGAGRLFQIGVSGDVQIDMTQKPIAFEFTSHTYFFSSFVHKLVEYDIKLVLQLNLFHHVSLPHINIFFLMKFHQLFSYGYKFLHFLVLKLINQKNVKLSGEFYQLFSISYKFFSYRPYVNHVPLRIN